MAQTTKWLHAIWGGEVEHINGVWPVFLLEQLIFVAPNIAHSSAVYKRNPQAIPPWPLSSLNA